ncbi:MAG: feruloyl-CoA synthase [Gammaproteobacteria bacterium]
MTKAPLAKIHFATPKVEHQPLPGGGCVLRSPEPLGPYPDKLGERLLHWAGAAPERTFLAQRGPDGAWREVSYAEAARQVEALGQALLDRGLSAERPVAILSDNGIDNALLVLAAMHVGVPAVPVSPAYSLMSQDHGKLRYIAELVTPGLVYAADGARFEPALRAVAGEGVEVVVSANPPASLPAILFDDLLATSPTPAVADAYARVGPDTIAKILFTSGSTGTPKGVINTQRMLCSNQQAIRQLWPFLEERAPRIVDWLPWSHTFGSNHNFNMMLFHGGSLYIDGGKPVPGLIEQTVANLREISPTLYFNVPRGFDMLLPYLEQDEALRENFFRELDLIFYAGAALPQNLWDRIEAVSAQARGVRVPLVSAWGSTETAPLVTSLYYPAERAGVIGLPAPGCELKMVPNGDKLELRVRGPNVTPGYWRNPEATRAAFDEEGYYCIGDAGRLVDPDDPVKGVLFDGRVAEDFKLLSGTWVHVGAVRVAAIAAGAPVIQDAVVTGHDREELGLLVFPNPAGCRSLCPDAPADAGLDALVGRPEVQAALRRGIEAYNAEHPGNSTRIARLLLMAEPPSIDANEITDKGYINQRAVLSRRAALVERLYASDGSDPDILIFD